MNWINPREQLPETCGEFLIIHKYYGVLKKSVEYEVVFYDGEKTWWGNDISYSTEQVMAWCELPDFPNFIEVK